MVPSKQKTGQIKKGEGKNENGQNRIQTNRT